MNKNNKPIDNIKEFLDNVSEDELREANKKKKEENEKLEKGTEAADKKSHEYPVGVKDPDIIFVEPGNKPDDAPVPTSSEVVKEEQAAPVNAPVAETKPVEDPKTKQKSEKPKKEESAKPAEEPKAKAANSVKKSIEDICREIFEEEEPETHESINSLILKLEAEKQVDVQNNFCAWIYPFMTTGEGKTLDEDHLKTAIRKYLYDALNKAFNNITDEVEAAPVKAAVPEADKGEHNKVASSRMAYSEMLDLLPKDIKEKVTKLWKACNAEEKNLVGEYMDLKLDYALAKVKSENFNESPEALEIKISKMYSEFAKNMAQHITEAIANVRSSIARKERAVNGPAMEAVNRNFDEAIEDYKKQKAESAKLLENSIKG
jgi:hypothetical protein